MKKTRMVFLAGMAMLAVAASGETLINGAGATFPYPIYSKWFNEYHKLHPDIQINYQSRGSGAGVQQVTAGTVDFGASDYTLTDTQIKEFATKRGSEILAFPTVLGAAVAAYNIPGVTTSLNFTPEALAGIYLGKITKWNDPELVKNNPGVKLPNADIVVIHRAEASGTTFMWTDYLSKVSKEWEMKVGRGASVNWPLGLGGQGSEGVTGQLKQTPNSIGYVELTYVLQNKIPYGKVKNAAGEFVQADLASVTAAAASAAKNMPDDFRVSITNAPGKGAYPISSFTWLLIPSKISDPTKKKALADFLGWMLKDGQTMTTALSYAPLPKEVVAKETKAIAKIN
ncbi:MAG TPA: phosphate ABC transporter substrate-binding protein PstS [Bryobacteraceae bacterium]|jgi:phosphate transport system substrate-binding protein